MNTNTQHTLTDAGSTLDAKRAQFVHDYMQVNTLARDAQERMAKLAKKIGAMPPNEHITHMFDALHTSMCDALREMDWLVLTDESETKNLNRALRKITKIREFFQQLLAMLQERK